MVALFSRAVFIWSGEMATFRLFFTRYGALWGVAKILLLVEN